jgi:hypothetical protein
MLEALVLRGVLSAVSLLFGSLGVFFLYFNLRAPHLIGHAILFLGIATVIVRFPPAE